MRARSAGNLSRHLPENPYSTIDQEQAGSVYRTELEDYEIVGNKDKVELWSSEDPNIGWKLHLNVAPDRVRAVADWLTNEGYRHKYLKAGTAEDGKVFTVYTGSRRKTEEEAQRISATLAGIVSRPVDNGEIEFAPGLVGRFTPSNPHTDQAMRFTGPMSAKYHHYGSVGMAWLVSDMNAVMVKRSQLPTEQFNAWYSQEKVAIERRAYSELAKEFGEYFTG